MQAHYESNQSVWTLTWKDVLLRLRLVEGALYADYFGPAAWVDSAAMQPAINDAIWETHCLVSVGLAPDMALARWDLIDWSQPSPLSVAIRLRSTCAPLAARIDLCQEKDTGLLVMRTELTNESAAEVLRLNHAVSASLCLPAQIKEIVHLSGRWGAETQVQRLALPSTQIMLESRSGKTSFEHLPYVALLAPDYTFVFELAWSGNWQMSVRRLADGRVTVSAGLNDWGLRHTLRPGETLALPEVFAVCARGDLNAATQRLHDYRRRFPGPDNQHPVPVQFNT